MATTYEVEAKVLDAYANVGKVEEAYELVRVPVRGAKVEEA